MNIILYLSIDKYIKITCIKDIFDLFMESGSKVVIQWKQPLLLVNAGAELLDDEDFLSLTCRHLN